MERTFSCSRFVFCWDAREKLRKFGRDVTSSSVLLGKILAFEQMTVGELHDRYADVFEE